MGRKNKDWGREEKDYTGKTIKGLHEVLLEEIISQRDTRNQEKRRI